MELLELMEFTNVATKQEGGELCVGWSTGVKDTGRRERLPRTAHHKVSTKKPLTRRCAP